MPWDELGELIKQRVIETNFIDPKNFKVTEWDRFWKARKKVGLKFDWRLAARCYSIWRSLRKQSDHFTVVVGREGMGKTTLATQMCAFIAPEMDLNDVVFDMPQYVNKLKKIGKNYKKNKEDYEDRCIQIDEGGISLFSRESLSKSNKILAKTFMVQRFLNVHVGICIPYYWNLDTMIRHHRINTLIIIKERGQYKTVTGKGIKILNKLGSKDKDKVLWQIPIPYDYFWEGRFQKEFPGTISSKEYEKHKFKHITNFLDEVSLESQEVNMVSADRLQKEFGIPAKEVGISIENGELEGKKIGNKYFISKKAYKTLISK